MCHGSRRRGNLCVIGAAGERGHARAAVRAVGTIGAISLLELRAGAAAVVGIGVGSPVARLEEAGSAGGRRPQSAAVGAELGARAAAVAIAVRGVRGYSDAVLGADRHLAIGGGGRGTRGPQSAQSEP